MNAMEIAAYLDHRADAATTQRFEAHLAECDFCRQDLLEAGRVLRRARRPGRVLVLAALAAAAVLVVVAIPAVGRNDRLWRDGGGDAEHRLVAYGPLGEVRTDSFRFVWGAAPSVMTYRLTVTGADGTLIWSTNTPDTSAILEPGHPLVTGTTYYWAADALLRDGSALTTGIRAFHLGR
jgi:hypothetical protein